MQQGDLYQTYASIDILHSWFGYGPATLNEVGLTLFVQGEKNYYKRE